MGTRQGLHCVHKKKVRRETGEKASAGPQSGAKRVKVLAFSQSDSGSSVKQAKTRALLSTETKATDLDPNKNAL